jgi:hypothetical protein
MRCQQRRRNHPATAKLSAARRSCFSNRPSLPSNDPNNMRFQRPAWQGIAMEHRAHRYARPQHPKARAKTNAPAVAPSTARVNPLLPTAAVICRRHNPLLRLKRMSLSVGIGSSFVIKINDQSGHNQLHRMDILSSLSLVNPSSNFIRMKPY